MKDKTTGHDKAKPQTYALLIFMALIITVFITTIVFNKEQPSSMEYKLANTIIMNIKKDYPYINNTNIFFEAKKSTVTINIYYPLEQIDQNKIVNSISSKFGEINNNNESKHITVYINYFNERKFTHHRINGSTYSELIKSDPVRSIVIK